MPEKKLEDLLEGIGKNGVPLEEPMHETQHAQELVVSQGVDNIEARLKSVDSHLVLPRGKYTIDFDIVVREQGVLEIEPGTEIYFGEDGGIISYGTLKAKGTEHHNIVFTAQKRKWKNITIAGRCASDTILEYCNISQGSGRKEVPETATFESSYGISYYGGGLYVRYADPTIRYCTIRYNKADHGGGVELDFSNAVLEKNLIEHNEAEDSGGGLWFIGSNATLSGNIIRNNTANNKGGGLYLLKSNLIMKENIIEYNKCKWSNSNGGGLLIAESSPTLQENTIRNNEADWGGGFYYIDSNPTMLNNVIKNNTARKCGGGLHFTGESKPTLKQNTITNNLALGVDYEKGRGGGVLLARSVPKSYITQGDNKITNNNPDDIFSFD